MVRDAPWRKLGGKKFRDDNDVFVRVYNNLLLHEYCTFITFHQCTFNLLFSLFLHCVSKNIPNVLATTRESIVGFLQYSAETLVRK